MPLLRRPFPNEFTKSRSVPHLRSPKPLCHPFISHAACHFLHPIFLKSIYGDIWPDDNNNNKNNINCHLLTTYHMPTTSHTLFLILKTTGSERQRKLPETGHKGETEPELHSRSVWHPSLDSAPPTGICEGAPLLPLFPAWGMWHSFGKFCVRGLLALLPGDTTIHF